MFTLSPGSGVVGNYAVELPSAPGETQQDPKKNLPINSEVNFRKEYQEKHPDQKAKTEKGMKVYEQRGYTAITEKK